MENKRTIRYIVIAIIAIAIAVIMFIVIKPFSKSEGQEQELLTPLEIDDTELVTSYATVSDYYEAIGEDPEEMFHSENGFGLEEYPYRVFVKNRGILYQMDLPDDCGNGLEPCLSVYIDKRIPDGDNYTAEIEESTFREVSTGYIYNIRIPDYDNLKVRVYYDNSSHGFAFSSDLDPEDEESDEERPSYKDYIIQEITDIVTEDARETSEELEEYNKKK